ETAQWMPRLEWFRVVGDDVMDVTALRRALQTQRTGQILQTAEGRFQTTGPAFQGRFTLTFRHIPGGTQMYWRLHDSQEFPDKTGAMRMHVNNCSFTLHPAPYDPSQTILAYNLHVEAAPMLNPVLHFFVPGDQIKELPSFTLSLLNRSIDSSWTSKRGR